MRILFVLFSLLGSSAALKMFANRYAVGRQTMAPLQAIPLELTGQLDATKSWDVKFIFNGEEKVRDFFNSVMTFVQLN